jgi:hypothetical protein
MTNPQRLRFSDLPAATALDGTEQVPLVQGSETVQTTTQDIANLSASYNGTVINTVATLVSSLPTAIIAGIGARAFVTDANSSTFGTSAVGGGGNAVPVYSDGVDWFIG